MRLDGPSLAPPDGGPARRLICLLHGLGADGADLLPLGMAYQSSLPDAAVVAPNAPFPCDVAPVGRMWFSVRDLRPDTRRMGVRVAAPYVNAFLDAELARRGLSASALIIGGFSQGAMVALHVGLTRDPAPLAVISHSGLLADETLALPVSPTWRAPSLLLTHGDSDPLLPPDCLTFTERALKAKGLAPEAHLLKGLGHGIDPATVSLGLSFLHRVIDAANR
jgi:phospholipase/carboxylesterase